MSSQNPDSDRWRRIAWRIVIIGGAASAVAVAVAVQPAWAVPIGAGLTAAGFLWDVLHRNRRDK